MTRSPEDRETARAASRAALAVPGVAHLSPRATERLHTTVRPLDLSVFPGVRVAWRTDPDECQVEIRLAVRAGHPATHVAQQVREAVVEAVYTTYPQTLTTPVTVAVTVTEIVF